jgi:hypothetical protein
MFQLTAVSSELSQKLQNPEKFFPPEVSQELVRFLEILQRDGQFTRTNFYDVNTHHVSGEYLHLFYRPQIVRKGTRVIKREVLIVDVGIKSADVFKQRFSIEDSWNDNDVLSSLPQYDDPGKLIKAIMMLHRGILDSEKLGYELGHRGKKSAYVRRHGNYAKHALEQLKLVTRIQEGRSLSTHLTEKGVLIAEAPNEGVQFRLLIEAMLNYKPIWEIILTVTHRESAPNNGQVLTDSLVRDLIFPEILQLSDTSNRRSQTLKNWIKWISSYAGIPICLHEEGMQLPIPMLYSSNGVNF